MVLQKVPMPQRENASQYHDLLKIIYINYAFTFLYQGAWPGLSIAPHAFIVDAVLSEGNLSSNFVSPR
jgi:hypothetical protein